MQGQDRMTEDKYIGTWQDFGRRPTNRVMIGIPMTGLLRSEWVLARYGQTIPCNWSQVDVIQWLDQFSPIRYMVADARNMIACKAVEEDFEWLLFIDHDVVLPPTTLLRMNDYMLENKVPIVAGLYFTRSVPAEPLVYRGRGTSYYNDWKLGDKIWVDGHGMGCTLINVRILRALYEESEDYQLGPFMVRRLFESPAKCWFDPETQEWKSEVGTEDLFFLDRIKRCGIFAKAGWPEYADKEFPFLVDTSIFCRHIDWDGVQYPARGEEMQYMPEPK